MSSNTDDVNRNKTSGGSPATNSKSASNSSSATIDKSNNATAQTGEDSVLTASIVRNLGDKMYEKRKQAAHEIESLIKALQQNRNDQGIKNVIKAIVTQFCNSLQPNSRKGGLLGLAATAVALQHDASRYLDDLVPAVSALFNDLDIKVRFHACESMYNIAKVSRGSMLAYFNGIFDGLFKLAADPDNSVKNASELLDRLMKDIVTEHENFEVEKFIPLIKERILTTDPYARQFLIKWLLVLDSVPDINMIEYLPEFLNGIFMMLSDPNAAIVQQADNALGEFLREMKETKQVDYGPIVKIVITHCSSKDDNTRVRALQWIHQILIEGKESILPYTADILGAELPCISHKQEAIRNAADEVNKELQHLVRETRIDVAFGPIVHVLGVEMVKYSVQTRLACLKWLDMLLNKNFDKVMASLEGIFALLLKALSDPHEEVVTEDLKVLSLISASEDNFNKFMTNLVKLFSTDQKLLSKAGPVVRQLSGMLNAEKMFRALSKILEDEEDLEFASTMIQTLNMTLLTANELADLRALIKKSPQSQEGTDLFIALYKSWSHNPVSTLSLCLLAQAYEQASVLVASFSEIEVTVNFLVQIDKLVQLLESPIFAYIRIQLLEPHKYPHLLKTLYGVLMLLPQSSAYETLKNRLETVQTLAMLHLIQHQQLGLQQIHKEGGHSAATECQLHLKETFDKLVSHFTKIQEKHRKFIRRAVVMQQQQQQQHHHHQQQQQMLNRLVNSNNNNQ